MMKLSLAVAALFSTIGDASSSSLSDAGVSLASLATEKNFLKRVSASRGIQFNADDGVHEDVCHDFIPKSSNSLSVAEGHADECKEASCNLWKGDTGEKLWKATFGLAECPVLEGRGAAKDTYLVDFLNCEATKEYKSTCEGRGVLGQFTDVDMDIMCKEKEDSHDHSSHDHNSSLDAEVHVKFQVKGLPLCVASICTFKEITQDDLQDIEHAVALEFEEAVEGYYKDELDIDMDALCVGAKSNPGVPRKDSEDHGSHDHGSHDHAPESKTEDSKDHGSHDHGSHDHAPEPTKKSEDSEDHGSHDHGSHDHAPEPSPASETEDSKDHGSHDHGSHDHAPESNPSKATKKSNRSKDDGSHDHGSHDHAPEPVPTAATEESEDHGSHDHGSHDHAPEPNKESEGHNSHDHGSHDHAPEPSTIPGARTYLRVAK